VLLLVAKVVVVEYVVVVEVSVERLVPKVVVRLVAVALLV
jgi:hypothetical protein